MLVTNIFDWPYAYCIICGVKNVTYEYISPWLPDHIRFIDFSFNKLYCYDFQSKIKPHDISQSGMSGRVLLSTLKWKCNNSRGNQYTSFKALETSYQQNTKHAMQCTVTCCQHTNIASTCRCYSIKERSKPLIYYNCM